MMDDGRARALENGMARWRCDEDAFLYLSDQTGTHIHIQITRDWRVTRLKSTPPTANKSSKRREVQRADRKIHRRHDDDIIDIDIDIDR
jgi:hypothetical protein